MQENGLDLVEVLSRLLLAAIKENHIKSSASALVEIRLSTSQIKV